jgi:hypothetical protein
MVTQIAGHYFETGQDGWLDGGTDCARIQSTFSPEGAFSMQLRDNSLEQSGMTSPVWNWTQFDSVTVEFRYMATGFETGEDFWLRYFNGTAWNTVRTWAFPAQFNNTSTYSQKIKFTPPFSASTQIRFQCDASDNTDQVYIDAVIVKGFKSTATSSCTDGIKNGQETGIDCGGPTCAACPTCSDGIKNGSETGIDCGGSCAPCVTSSCTDGIKNGNETGIDCGGSCPACPTCSDGVQNGNETGIDCGGSCPACPSGGSFVVLSGHYFETGWDGWVDGGSDCFRYQGPLSPEGAYSIRLRDNSDTQSAMTSPPYQLANYTSAQVEFKIRAEGMEAGQNFALQYFNGSTWSVLGTFVCGTHFQNNQLYTYTVTFQNNLANSALFRFMCFGLENDDIVYVDAVIIRASNNAVNPGISYQITDEMVRPVDGSVNQSSLAVYPNPTKDLLHIATDEKVIRCMVFNISGQVMAEYTGSDASIDISRLNQGLYLVQIETEENVYRRKVIKE